MSSLRPYQLDLDRKIRDAWATGARNVLATAPTGSGKTVTFSHILAGHVGAACVIAHRQELVEQISIALAREGVLHTIIAPKPIVRNIIALHREELGGCWYDPNSKVAVAGVKTLLSRGDRLTQWCQQVTLWVMDEGHHVLRRNGWGKAVELFPNARGLGVTATPERADGAGLGSHADGVFDALVEGPSMRSLIEAGYLTDYVVWVPPSDLDMSGVEVSPLTGDFKSKQAVAAVRRSHIVGSVVEHYQARAAGKRGITFAVDVESALELAAAFMQAGVPAAAVSATTPARERYHTIRRFRAGELLQLVNVDIFGEGFDLPAIECVSFARPTMSRNLFVQQWGRALRPMHPGKVAIILDHVDNTGRHNGPPDIPRAYSLDRRQSRKRGVLDPDIVPSRTCVECSRPYEAALLACPYCGDEWSAEARSGPEEVEGDLVQLDRAQLDALYGAISKVDEPAEDMLNRLLRAGMGYGVAASARKNQNRRQDAQRSLRSLMGVYGAAQAARGRDDREAQKRFFYRYGLDVLTAQALGRPDARRLACRLIDDIQRGVLSA